MPPIASPQMPSLRQAASLLGREQGPEQFATAAHDGTYQNVVLNRNIPLARPLESLKLVWRGRLVVGTANYTAVSAEAPATLIDRIRITGNHARYNQQIPVDITGATAFVWPRLFGLRGNAAMIGTTRQAEPGQPYAQTLANLGNTGTYDLEVHYDIPTGLWVPTSAKRRVIPYYWFPQDWADTLSVNLFLGDRTSLGTPAGGSTTTWTAFGSASGTPTVYALTNYALLGKLARAQVTALIIRNEIRSVTGAVTAIASNVLLQTLMKQRTTNLVIKTGINLTGVTAGVQVYGSLLDTMLDRTQILADNRAIRNNPNNFAAKEYAGRTFGSILPQGYMNFTFISANDPLNMFRGDQVSPGGTFQLWSDIASANANNYCGIVQEQVFGDARGLLAA